MFILASEFSFFLADFAFPVADFLEIEIYYNKRKFFGAFLFKETISLLKKKISFLFKERISLSL